MSDQPVISRIARRLVERGRIPNDPSFRHGTEDVANICAIGPNGGKCEVCRRAFPDKAKRQKMNAKARRTNSCLSGTAGHLRCKGWRFAPGVLGGSDASRGASPCQCPCHTDGRGAPIPSLEEWMEWRAADEAERKKRFQS